ncbi:amidohydrolase family protein [Gynuella sunshinyii]|uniref:Putative metal-dependent hydrolase of the TIM-barrel fold n=1 Tax=Gynuella sunshinyii YC6258 TaxID=1445510 RepID=A0A0C5VS10_9GAMM|nr:putative metal-dependent hydrolase of the TIM-barrel fold [Gynuella sunshinyii YC6258]
MSSDYLPFHSNPSKPEFKVPAGAVDAHCHVFGPAAEFPFAPERKYTPCDASKHQLFALRDFLGFERNVIVQATCHGKNNDALVDALKASNGKARGVASVGADISIEELQIMHDAGVRGVRFNFVKRLVDNTPREVFFNIAEKIKPLGWHIVVYFEAPDFEDLKPFLLELGTTIVVDHMGRPDIALGVDHPQFQSFVDFMAENEQIWSKVSCPERLSLSGPDGYDDVVPFSKLLVEKFPDRVLWGTDWPHPNMTSHMPDDGMLVNFIPKIATTETLQQALLVDNPMRLYWQD